MNSEEILLCHHCGKIFYKLSTLESHTKWKHMEKSNDFMCEQCGKTFHKKFNLIKHLASGVHHVSESVKCALCEFRALTRKVMCGHYQNFHRIVLNESNVYFRTREEFFSWKVQYENRTRSRFVKMSSSRQRKNGLLRSTYFCHRDGNFRSKGKNLRHLKIKGSNKINAHCPAKIEVEMGQNLIVVSYIDTHLGHDLDITRMNLDSVERAIIAEKLALRVPFEQILDEINNKKHDNGVKRLNLLTRKDLWNIIETFKINPKNVVYNKTRMRRKKRLDKSKITLMKNQVYVKSNDDHSNNKQNENKIHSTEVEEEGLTDEQIISIKDEGSFYLCPISIKDENNEETKQYVIISGEHLTNDGSCLIINSKGELENISEHELVHLGDEGVQILEDGLNTCEDAGVQICVDGDQSCGDNEIQICEEDDVQTCENEDIKNDEVESCVSDGFQMLDDFQIKVCEDEFQICNGDAVEIYDGEGRSITPPICETLEADKTNLNVKCIKDELDKPEPSFFNKSTILEKSNRIFEVSEVQKNENSKASLRNTLTLKIGKKEYEIICNANENINESDSQNVFEIQKKENEQDSEMFILDRANLDNGYSYIKEEDVSMDLMPECEVTIDNLDGEQANEYIIIPEEDTGYSNLISSEGDAHQNINLFASHVSEEELLIGEEVSTGITNHLKREVSDSLESVEEDIGECEVDEGDGHQWDKKREVSDSLESVEEDIGECEVDEGDGHQWDKKREEVLHKLFNVHSLINNEHQLQVFSNNISSLENVLKSMSKSDEAIHEVHRQKVKDIKQAS